MSGRNSQRGARKPIPAAQQQAPSTPEATPPPPSFTSSASTTTTTPSSTPQSIAASNSPAEIVSAVWDKYLTTTPQRVKLIDVFMVFLIGVGVMQFVYCVIAGNYPFNAFLAGFSATVGQFVLTASLRIQTNPVNKNEFIAVSPERAFADFVFGSLILHFFCVNFIN